MRACPQGDIRRCCRWCAELAPHRFPTSSGFDHDGDLKSTLSGSGELFPSGTVLYLGRIRSVASKRNCFFFSLNYIHLLSLSSVIKAEMLDSLAVKVEFSSNYEKNRSFVLLLVLMETSCINLPALG